MKPSTQQELLALACDLKRQVSAGTLTLDGAAARLVAETPPEAGFTLVDARDFLRTKPFTEMPKP
jgi:hypothetical protein